ncbi:hypothetical protein HYE82_18800 [Streptomyces sp. BR123]|uniref:hypothetical protein n=1 Tax=Streptomyces sp. BR123 TaxID=2749828 RepID=UPI0015C4300A|nr:hypothetical protein [Streptomyces sp. BR123]NXY96402.1 hypothetical protein [Streptomyces sp. BR123]
MTEISEPPLAPGACCDTAPCTCQPEPLTPDRLAEIAESHPGSWYDGEWRSQYVDSTADEAGYCVVLHQESGQVLAELPDWAGPIALFIADAHDAVPALLAEVDRLSAAVDWLANELRGANLDRWEEEQDCARMRLAWQSARRRAAGLSGGLIREVGNRDSWKGWAKAAEAEVDRLRAELAKHKGEEVDLRELLAERNEQIAYLLAAEPTLDDDQPAAPR